MNPTVNELTDGLQLTLIAIKKCNLPASIDTITALRCRTKNAVWKQLKQLQELGIIEVEKKPFESGNRNRLVVTACSI